MGGSLNDFVQTFPWVENDDSPWVEWTKKLGEAKVGLVSTGGIYAEGDKPFAITTAEDVDESYRKIPSNTDLTKLRLAHEHYDKSNALQDINVVFPLERLKAMATSGIIGSVCDTNFSVTGFIPKPMDYLIPVKK